MPLELLLDRSLDRSLERDASLSLPLLPRPEPLIPLDDEPLDPLMPADDEPLPLAESLMPPRDDEPLFEA